jgi:hypothetical protein
MNESVIIHQRKTMFFHNYCLSKNSAIPVKKPHGGPWALGGPRTTHTVRLIHQIKPFLAHKIFHLQALFPGYNWIFEPEHLIESITTINEGEVFHQRESTTID